MTNQLMPRESVLQFDEDIAEHQEEHAARHTKTPFSWVSGVSVHRVVTIGLVLLTLWLWSTSRMQPIEEVIARDTTQPLTLPAKRLDNPCTADGCNFYIVTPVARHRYKEELMRLATSIRWDCVTQWFLIYDTGRQHDLEPLFSDSPQVTEIYYQADEGNILGNMQRNRALQDIVSGLIYWLDDDNIMHPNFWNLLRNMSLGHITTFDQMRLEDDPPRRLNGGTMGVGLIDTAMMVMDRALIGDLKWEGPSGNADGLMAEALQRDHPDKIVYINEVAAYHHGLV